MVGKAPFQPVPTTIQAMADDLAGGRLHLGRPSQHGHGGRGAEPARIRRLISSWAALMGPIPGSETRAGATAMTSSRSSTGSVGAATDAQPHALGEWMAGVPPAWEAL
jgi:hypothetical protein